MDRPSPPASSRPDTLRLERLQSHFAELRPWGDAGAVERVLQAWAQAARGQMLSRFQAVDVAEELRKLGRFEPDLEPPQALGIAAFMIANIDAGRSATDYGDGFLGQIVGLNERTRRRYIARARLHLAFVRPEHVGDRQELLHVAAELWLARRVHYHHELWKRIHTGQKRATARRAIQRARVSGI